MNAAKIASILRRLRHAKGLTDSAHQGTNAILDLAIAAIRALRRELKAKVS